jgi:hypothetical protein
VLLRAPLGNVFEGQKNRGVRILFVEYLSGTKKHRASADTGKVLLDFVIFHYGVLRRNVLQQKPKRGDIPLALAQRVDRPTLDILTAHSEFQIE